MKKLSFLLLPFIFFACDDACKCDNRNKQNNPCARLEATDLNLKIGNNPSHILAASGHTYIVDGDSGIVHDFESDDPDMTLVERLNLRKILKETKFPPKDITLAAEIYDNYFHLLARHSLSSAGFDIVKKGKYFLKGAIPTLIPIAMAIDEDGKHIIVNDTAKKTYFVNELLQHLYKITCENPASIRIWNKNYYVIASGPTENHNDSPKGELCIQIFDHSKDKVESRVIKRKSPGIAASAGQALLMNDTLYIGSQSAAVIFVFDLKKNQFVEDIVLDADSTKQSVTIPVRVNKQTLAILDKASDSVHFYSLKDRKISHVVPLDNDPDTLQNPVSAVVDSSGKLRVVAAGTKKIYEIRF